MKTAIVSDNSEGSRCLWTPLKWRSMERTAFRFTQSTVTPVRADILVVNVIIIHRFSNFVKSGGEAFLLGTAKVAINSADYVTIVDTAGVISWSQPYPEAMYSADISSPKKESKLKGLYQLQ